jgi:hypothetical protein
MFSPDAGPGKWPVTPGASMKKVPSALAALVLVSWAFAPRAAAAPYSADLDDARGLAPAQSADPAGGWMNADGMRVFIDPQTRRLRRPDAADIEKLAAQRQQALPPVAPQVRVNANGSLSALLDDSFASYLIATRQPDGTLRVDCLPAKAAAAALEATAPKSGEIARQRPADEQ